MATILDTSFHPLADIALKRMKLGVRAELRMNRNEFHGGAALWTPYFPQDSVAARILALNSSRIRYPLIPARGNLQVN